MTAEPATLNSLPFTPEEVEIVSLAAEAAGFGRDCWMDDEWLLVADELVMAAAEDDPTLKDALHRSRDEFTRGEREIGGDTTFPDLAARPSEHPEAEQLLAGARLLYGEVPPICVSASPWPDGLRFYDDLVYDDDRGGVQHVRWAYGDD